MELPTDFFLKIPWFMVATPDAPHRVLPCLHRMAALKPTPVYYDRPLLDMHCRILSENHQEDFVGVLEDDACPVRQGWLDELRVVERELRGYDRQWDILYLGGLKVGTKVNQVTPNLWIPLEGAYCTHALVYRKSSFSRVLSWFDVCDRDRSNFHNGHLVDHWLRYRTGTAHLLAKPMIITQLNGEGVLENAISRHLTMTNSYVDFENKPDCFDTFSDMEYGRVAE